MLGDKKKHSFASPRLDKLGALLSLFLNSPKLAVVDSAALANPSLPAANLTLLSNGVLQLRKFLLSVRIESSEFSGSQNI